MVVLDASRPYSGESLIGREFERWFVESYAGKDGRNRPFWNCRCQCGTRRAVDGDRLLRGNSRSCGCFHRQIVSKQNGNSKRIEYVIWRNIVRRCVNKDDAAYHNYGGRGIRICDRWLNSFDAFFEDVGERPDESLTLGRIDNDGHYEPGNVEWQTDVEQANNKRNSRFLTHDGETMTLNQWSRKLGICREVIRDRIDRGATTEEAFAPPKPRYRMLTHNGKTQDMKAWSVELGIPHSTIRRRLELGMSDDKALSRTKYPVGRKPGVGQTKSGL